MRYDDPELRERLAAEYVLGTMPIRARRRFERLMNGDASLAALVAHWSERLAPLDAATPEIAPPARVWRAIERRVQAPARVPIAAPARVGALAFWRGLALAAVGACAALIFYVAISPAPAPPKVIAILADSNGATGWVALAGPLPGQVSVAAVRPSGGGDTTAFELWGIAAGAPRPLGLLQTEPDRPLLLSAALLPDEGGTLAVSREPPGGSPSGLPTGPVVYQGKVLIAAAQK
jgi:anti-sigma-K factor RskA